MPPRKEMVLDHMAQFTTGLLGRSCDRIFVELLGMNCKIIGMNCKIKGQMGTQLKTTAMAIPPAIEIIVSNKFKN